MKCLRELPFQNPKLILTRPLSWSMLLSLRVIVAVQNFRWTPFFYVVSQFNLAKRGLMGSQSRLLHLVTVAKMLLARQWQAMFMCLFPQRSRTPEWLVIPRWPGRACYSIPPILPRNHKCLLPHVQINLRRIVSPRHFRDCLDFDCIYLQCRTSLTRPGLWKIVVIVAHNAMVFVFLHDLNARCGPGDCSALQLQVANQVVFF